MKKTISLFAVWAMIGAPNVVYGVCSSYTPALSGSLGCISDADCEETTTSSSGVVITAACPSLSVGLKRYVGIERHSFTHTCNRVKKYNTTDCTYYYTGSCAELASSDVRYACCAGYYGTCTDNTDITTCSCARCPNFADASGTVYGTTASVSATNATNYAGTATTNTDCYIAAEKSYDDVDGTGAFEFTSQCNYSN